MSKFGNGVVCTNCNEYQPQCVCKSHEGLEPTPTPTPTERIWVCKIGGIVPGYRWINGADAPMRRAVEATFQRLTGVEPEFCFSGWSGELTEGERKIVEEDRQRRNVFERFDEGGEAVISVRRDREGGIFLDRWPKRCSKTDLAELLSWINGREKDAIG